MRKELEVRKRENCGGEVEGGKECYTLVQAYAPTDDSKSEAKDQFYAEMQKVVGNVGRRAT